MGKRKESDAATVRSAARRMADDRAKAVGLVGAWQGDSDRLWPVLDDLVLPPLLAGQYCVWRRGGTPVACAAWAFLDRAAEERVLTGRIRLGPTDWQGGERLWLVYLVAPYGGFERFARDLRDRVLPGHEIHVLTRGLARGRPRVELWASEVPRRGPVPSGPATRPLG